MKGKITREELDQTLTTDLENINSQLDKNMKTSFKAYDVSKYLAGRTDTEAIKYCIKLAKENGGGIVFTPNIKTYEITETIHIPLNVSFDGCTSYIITKVVGWAFSINSSNCMTWDIQYAYDDTYFKNVRLVNGNPNDNWSNKVQGARGIFCASPIKFFDVYSRFLFSTIVYSNNYIDNKYLENITCEFNYGSDYAINMSGLGDNLTLKNLRFGYTQDNEKQLRVNFCNGGVLEGIIGSGQYLIENSNAICINNCHLEGGVFTFVNSGISLENIYMWKKNGTTPINIKWINYTSKDVVMKNININYVFENGDLLSPNEYDIYMEGAGTVTFDNVFRNLENVGNVGKGGLCGVITNNKYFNNYSHWLSKYCIFRPASSEVLKTLNTCKLPNNFQHNKDNYLFGNITLSEYGYPFKLPLNTYFYRAVIYLDTERALGYPMGGVNGGEKSINITNNKYVPVFNISGRAELGCKVLRLYRGTSSCQYNSKIDLRYGTLPALIGGDFGDTISKSYFWENRAVGNVDNYNTCKRITINGDNVIAYSYDIPLYGSWVEGDYYYNMNMKELGNSGSKYMVKGYIRKTTGSTNIIGVDWIEERIYTGN